MTPRGSDNTASAQAGSIETVTAPLHAHRYGPAGPARVLAVHGLTGHGRRWETLAARHLADVPIVAPDLIGHGHSTWDAPWTIDANVAALAALLDADGGEPVVVLGHSFGGALALHLAVARPDLIAGVALMDPAIGLDGRRMREIADQMYASPDYADRDEARAEKVHGSWADVDPAEVERELDEHLVDLPNGRVAWRFSVPAALCYWSELTRPAVIPRDGTPTTLVRATRTTPAYVTDELVAGLDAGLGGDFTLLDWDSDHMVPLAMPAETADVVRGLLG